MKKITILFLLVFCLPVLGHAQTLPQSGYHFSYEYSIVPVDTTAYRYPQETLDTIFLNSPRQAGDALLQIRVYVTTTSDTSLISNIEIYASNAHTNAIFRQGSVEGTTYVYPGKHLLETFYIGIRGSVPKGSSTINGVPQLSYISFNQEFHFEFQAFGDPSANVMLDDHEDVIKIPAPVDLAKSASLRLVPDGTWVNGDIQNL